MLSEGLNETEIAKELNVGQSTICRDLKAIKKESQKMIESIIENVLPYEYRKSFVSIEQVIKECWKIYHDTGGQWTNKNKLDILKLIKEAATTRLDLLVQGPVYLKTQKLDSMVKELTEENVIPKKSFFNLGSPPRGYNDLR